MRKLSARDRLFSFLLLLPAIIIVGFTIFYPMVKSIGISFLDYRLSATGDYKWNNFANYIEIFRTGEFVSALVVTVKFMVSVVALLFIIGLLLAVVLNKQIGGRGFLRSLALMPWTVPTLITALLWMWIYQPQYGVLNYILMRLHIIDRPISWVTSVKFALPSVVVAALWKQVPFMFTMMLAGLQSIPKDLYEAAMIDGASNWQTFFSITLPMLSNVIKATLLISIIENFKQFPLFWVMTGGGPMDKTTTLAILTYKNSFFNLNFGKGTAVSTCWLVILVVFTLVYNKLFAVNEQN